MPRNCPENQQFFPMISDKVAASKAHSGEASNVRFLANLKSGESPISSGFVLKEEPLSLAIDFVAIQIVLVRPVSVVRDDGQLSLDIRVVPENCHQLATRNRVERWKASESALVAGFGGVAKW
jgi:hypothetical protein